MKHLHSIVSNSFLALVLFAMLFLPIGAMGLTSIQGGEGTVLSETSIREDEDIEYTHSVREDVQYYQVEETSESTDLRQEINYR